MNPTGIVAAEASTGTPGLVTNPNMEIQVPALYLHPSENPAVALVTPLLKGSSNFHAWNRDMRFALRSKNKLGFIDGSTPVPGQNDPQYANWERCNTMIVSWILRSVDPEIHQSLLYFENVADVWKDLCDRFGRGDAVRVAGIQREIHSLSQGARTVNTYFTHFRNLWDQLTQFRPIPRCACNPAIDCTNCELYQVVTQYRESDQIIIFLQGLNDNYAATRQQILLMDPMPAISRVLYLIQQQERQITLDSEGTTRLSPISHMANHVASNDNSASGNLGVNSAIPSNNFVAQAGGYRKPWDNTKKPQCTFCHGTGHTIDKCFKKHGYPPNWRFKGQNQGRPGTNFNSGYQPGNRVQSPTNVQAHSVESTNLAKQLNKLCLTSDQYNGLLAIMQNATPSNSVHASPTIANITSATVPSLYRPSSSLSNNVMHMSGPSYLENDW